MPAVTNAQIRRPVLRYHGGKWRLAPWIISHFPKHSAYVEPFGGGASVLMQKEPSREEVYNDLDGDIVNVFRVLRNPFKAYILEHLLSLTPYAREEFEGAYEEAVSDVEQARRTIIRAFMAQGSGGATRNDINGWRSRRVSSRWPVADWQSYPCEIPLFVERLRNVTIENRPAIDVIKRYDSTDTLIYADPPYLPETRTPDGQRAYRHEMTDEDHAELRRLSTAQRVWLSCLAMTRQCTRSCIAAGRWSASRAGQPTMRRGSNAYGSRLQQQSGQCRECCSNTSPDRPLAIFGYRRARSGRRGRWHQDRRHVRDRSVLPQGIAQALAGCADLRGCVRIER